jgi:dTDP-4-dehydrorhamnose reductase
MRILLIGGAGMLGHELWRHLHSNFEVWVTLRRSFECYAKYGLFEERRTLTGIDAANDEHLIRAFLASKPEAVINCAGIIKQRKEAHDALTSLTVNSLLPHRLARIAEIAGARLVHISTDCVFSGQKGNYIEDDVSDAEDLYGRTKYLGEIHGPHCVTLRSSIIGHELDTRSGLIEWFLSQAGTTIKGFKHAIYTGFTTLEMARIIELILVRHRVIYGLWQVSSDPITKYDLLQIARQCYEWKGEILADEAFVCDRSLNSARFRAFTGYKPPSWREMIAELAARRQV